jgi:hypothetical protein
VGWWPFNGNANDESGNGNNGAVNGATLTADRFGSANSAYEFYGGNTRIIVSQPILPAQESSYSISLWAFFNSFNSSNELVCNRPSNSFDHKYRVFVRSDLPNNPVSFAQRNGNILGGIINGSISTGAWYHVVASADVITGTVNLYINGQLMQSTALVTGSIPNQLTGTTFGANYASGQPGYDPGIDGFMDEIGIWNRALDECEIRALYNSGAQGVSPTPVSFSGLNSSYSPDDEPATLFGSPSGGTFIGPGVSGNTFDPASAGVGTHSITYTWFDNCGGFNTAGLCTTVDQGSGIGGSNMTTGGFLVYPNPNRGQFTVEMELSGLVSLQVFDARGALVHNEVFRNQSGKSTRMLDLSNLAKGSYTLTVTNDGQNINQQVVIQ